VLAGRTVRAGAASLRASYQRWLSKPRSAAVSRARALLRRLTDRWRRSLQLRVTAATLVLCAVVVTMLGYVLMQNFVTEIYANKQDSAESVVEQGWGTAKSQGFWTPQPNSASSGHMWNLAAQLYSTGGGAYEVYVTIAPNTQGLPVYPYSTGDEKGFYRMAPGLPASLVKKVTKEGQNGKLQQEWASVAVGSSANPVAGLAFGAPLGSRFQLYYFFPLGAVQQSITSMQRTMLLVGIAVVFLLVAIAWLVTRWVVVPVRLAAHKARRLSTGALSERMEVRGGDELAALATAFNEMAASLQDKLEELEDLSNVQRQFVSDVSHELRTPMTTIRLASDVLYSARNVMATDAATAAELMQGQLERFESLLTDLLEISRYDANAATLDAEPVDVGTIVLQSADDAQQLAERCGIKIEFRLPAEPCIAEVDRRRVERILRNLLVNAVEHGEHKGVVVTAAMDSAAVAVSVRDFGVGLAPGEEHLVFDRFWRADPARARSSGGTGLGLSIALEDARLHNGWLEAWGEPGRGSVFRLTLPRVVGDQLQGSPLPLGPYQAGIEEAELPDLPPPSPVLLAATSSLLDGGSRMDLGDSAAAGNAAAGMGAAATGVVGNGKPDGGWQDASQVVVTEVAQNQAASHG
jgi:two-component system, OmpR family, sensor histidine kinase MtrB